MLRQAIRALFALTIGVAISLVLAEGALRIYSAAVPKFPLRALDPMDVQIEPDGPTGFRQRPGAIFHYANGTTASTNSLGFRGPVVALQRSPGTIRIILLGGSDSFGWSVADSETVDAFMRRLLAERFPADTFEVVNLGFDGYDSYQDLQRFRSDGLAMHPSIVIANTGPNDVRNAWYPNLRDADPRTLLWAAELQRLRSESVRGGPTLWTRVKHYSVLARLPGYLHGQIVIRRETVQKHVAQTAGQGAPRPPFPDAADYFERNVRQIIDLSTSAGAAVLLSTPPSALPSYPPDTTSQLSYWIYNAKTTQDYRDLLAARLAALASDSQKAGRSVRYIAPIVPPGFFLDDAHLKGEGYRVLAAAFVDGITPFIKTIAHPSSKPAGSGAPRGNGTAY